MSSKLQFLRTPIKLFLLGTPDTDYFTFETPKVLVEPPHEFLYSSNTPTPVTQGVLATAGHHIAKADLWHVNIVWASPDQDAGSSEFRVLTAGAPREAFTAQAHARGSGLSNRCAQGATSPLRMPSASQQRAARGAEFPSNELFPPPSRQTALYPFLLITFTLGYPSNPCGLQDWSPEEIRQSQRPS